MRSVPFYRSALVRAQDRPITFWLRALVLACVLPAWAAATLLVLRALEQEREAQVEASIVAARSLVHAVDAKLTAIANALELLARSRAFAEGDSARVRAIALQVAARFGPAHVAVIEPSGQMVMSTAQPPGTALPVISPLGAIATVVATRRPAVTDMRLAPTTGERSVVVLVPTVDDGASTHVFGLALPLASLQPLVRRDDLGPGRMLSILDGTGTIIARSGASESAIGLKATPDLVAAAAHQAQGTLEAATVEGEAAFGAFVRSSVSGWTAVAGIRRPPLFEARATALWLTVAGAALLILVGYGLARLIARRIAGAVGSLRDPALALAEGRPVARNDTGIAEVTRMGSALQHAAERLRDQQHDRLRITRMEHAAAHAERTVQRLQTLIEAAPDPTVLLDRHATIRFANRRVGVVFDAAPGALEGRGIETLLAPGQIELLRAPLRRLFDGQAQAGTGAGRELMGRRADGTTFPIEVTANPLVLEGEPLVMAAIRDIGARKRLEREVESHRAQMQASNRLAALGIMAGGVAHEINNPLAVIHATASDLAELAEADPALPPEVRESAETVVGMAARIQRIVTSLRFLARDGTADPVAPVRVADIVAHALDVGAERFRLREIALRVAPIPADLTLCCREVQLSQLLMNLLQNGFDAAAAGLAPRWVALDVRAEPDGVAFEVTDSGDGVPAHLREKIMEPFFTTKPVGEGTGLGLSLGTAIARQHGGTLTLVATPGGPTRFRLFVPHGDVERRP